MKHAGARADRYGASRRLTKGVLVFCVAGLLVSCAAHPQKHAGSLSSPATSSASVPPTELLSSQELGPPMMLEQRLTGQVGGKESSLRCVLQLTGGVLTVVGLTPFGSRAFVLTQTGTDYELEKFVDQPLPFDPRHVLVDVQRVLFRRVVSHKQRAADGTHESVENGERIREQWQAGRVVQRTFVAADGTTLASVTFDGPADPVVAQRVELHDAHFGYTLVLETVAQRVLAE